MPSSHSATSTSFAKMENGGYGQRSSGFSFGRIVGDPFALATISIGIVSRSCPSPVAPSLANLVPQLAWIISFVSSIISAIHGGFPNFAWWTLVFMFFCIVGVTVTVASDAERTYHVAVRCLALNIPRDAFANSLRLSVSLLLASYSPPRLSTRSFTRPLPPSRLLPPAIFCSP